MSKARFSAELIEGHKGVTVVLVPFDPEQVWDRRPFRLEGRRHGWVVEGTANRCPFVGYIGERWGRFFIIIDPALRERANASVGDSLAITIEPTTSAHAIDEAREQSKLTTQPKQARPDAIEPPVRTRAAPVSETGTAGKKRRPRR